MHNPAAGSYGHPDHGAAESGDRPPQRSSGRPQTSHRRLDTARPETSTSSVGEIPQQTFFPDNDEEDLDEAEEDFQSDDDEDADVFAFERPQTGAVNLQTIGVGNSRPPIARLATSKSRALTTADTSRSVSFGFDVNDLARDNDRVEEQPSGVDSLSHLSYYDPATTRQPPGLNLNAAAYTPRHDDRNQQRPSVVSATLVGAPSTAHTKNSQMLSKHDVPTKVASGDSDGPSDQYHEDGLQQNWIEMAAYQNRPDTQASWNISELRGATTIPDGITTKGDGMGGLQPKVIAEDIKYDGANVFEDPDLEDSPYPEVRASVSNIDDPDLPGKLNRSLLSLRMDRVSSVVFTLSSSYHPFFHHRLGICYHWSRYQYIFLLPRTWAGNIAFGSTVSSCSCRQRGSVTNLLAIDIADSWRTRLADSWPGACLSMWYIYLDGWVVSRSI
jgi:hypothetical protein